MARNIYFSLLLASGWLVGEAGADPCGMVPPIYTGPGAPITRIGEQQTYVFFKDGLETFVIRPGFSGKVDEFGMLIPFPSPPAIRKVPDHIFPHIAAAIDPPEVVVDFSIRLRTFARSARLAEDVDALGAVRRDEVRVLREEAVGMYEVAVLEAGSAAALRKWMDAHQYRYPDGMDQVTEDYVEAGWCFVAVKTQVGLKQEVDPQPGQRAVNTRLPEGVGFDGHVQAMGFRFQTDELVVPMRLSAFNDGELRNVVYLLTDGPRRIRAIPEEYVVRQISGEQLIRNVTDLLPVRYIGLTPEQLRDEARRILPQPPNRDPGPKNGAARDLFASDLLALQTGELALRHEEQEKALLRIGERLGLRGGELDKLHADALRDAREKTVTRALDELATMVLTVVDGDFPREVLASQNLTFAEYEMPAEKNNTQHYEANLKGPAPKKQGVLRLGCRETPSSHRGSVTAAAVSFGGIVLLGALAWMGRGVACRVLPFALTACLAMVQPLAAAEQTIDALIAALAREGAESAAVKSLLQQAEVSQAVRDRVIDALVDAARDSDHLPQRGWAIAALAEVGGLDVDELLLDIHADDSQPPLVRTWAAAGRVTLTQSTAGLVEKASLITEFPALGRPISQRLLAALASEGDDAAPAELLRVSLDVPQLQSSLAAAILAAGGEPLCRVMTSAADQRMRWQAAAYLGTLAAQGDTSVAESVVAAYRFDAEAEDIPWQGGPLFVPALAWQQQPARDLAGQLIAWHVWCDVRGRTAEQQQIHNNLRSLQLAAAAGYQSPGFQAADSVAWLKVWRVAVGRQAVVALLREQGLDAEPKYQAAVQ